MKHVKLYENLKSLDITDLCKSNFKRTLVPYFFVIQRCNLTMLMPTLQQCSFLFFSVTPKVYLFSNGENILIRCRCHFCGPKMGHLREKCAFVASLEGIFGFQLSLTRHINVIPMLLQVSSHDFESTSLYYILSELKNTARPAQIKTNYQTFDT